MGLLSECKPVITHRLQCLPTVTSQRPDQRLHVQLGLFFSLETAYLYGRNCILYFLLKRLEAGGVSVGKKMRKGI